MKNNSSNQVKLPFGLRDGELVHISTVTSGLPCQCYCAACDATLIAKKGIKKAHHFAHYQSDECEHAVETALHFAAKKVLEESAQITLPELIIYEQVYSDIGGQSFTKTGSAKVCEQHIAYIENIALEKSLTHIVPDVRLPIEEFSEIYKKPMFIGVSETAINVLSADDQERFQERAGIHEFCGGLSRKEAERLAYIALFND
jgi:hypothetical protein